MRAACAPHERFETIDANEFSLQIMIMSVEPTTIMRSECFGERCRGGGVRRLRLSRSRSSLRMTLWMRREDESEFVWSDTFEKKRLPRPSKSG
jgi:hypothetical protein